jgi:hypothetical protein
MKWKNKVATFSLRRSDQPREGRILRRSDAWSSWALMGGSWYRCIPPTKVNVLGTTRSLPYSRGPRTNITFLFDRPRQAGVWAELFEGTSNFMSGQMDSYPSCVTAVAVSACRALNRFKQIAPGNRAVKFA